MTLKRWGLGSLVQTPPQAEQGLVTHLDLFGAIQPRRAGFSTQVYRV